MASRSRRWIKYLGSQVAVDVGCETDVVHRMNEGYDHGARLKVC